MSVNSAFTLHPKLAADCSVVGELNLCRVLLMEDARFPWLILVPMLEGAVEVFDLSPQHQAQLMVECAMIAKQLKQVTHADKINIATLGNQVPQLHVHTIARFRSDAAWPQPVWSHTEPRIAYTDAARESLCGALCSYITKM